LSAADSNPARGVRSVGVRKRMWCRLVRKTHEAPSQERAAWPLART
jgi:hypothetical protein